MSKFRAMVMSLCIITTCAATAREASAGRAKNSPWADRQDAEHIAWKIEGRAKRLASCTGGRDLAFTVASDGRAVNPVIDPAGIASDPLYPLGYDEAGLCSLRALKGLRFPLRLSGRQVTVNLAGR